MTVENFFNLFLIELKENKNLWTYYKFHTSEKSFVFRKAYFCERLQYVLDNIGSREQTIWDCGCGYGTTALFLALNNYAVYGTTLEFYFSEIERRKSYWSQYGDVTLFQYRYEDLFESEYEQAFDTILLQDTLHHVEPIEKGLEILSRSLKPSGKLMIMEENGANIIQNIKLLRRRGLNKTISLYDERLQRNVLLGNENIRSLKRWEKLLYKAGFKIPKASIQYIRFLPPSSIAGKSDAVLIARERLIAKKIPFLKNRFYFGLNFIAENKSDHQQSV